MQATTEPETTKPAAFLGELVEKNLGMLTPEIVLDAARPASSPIHSCFCWSDGIAAEKYRLIQAASLIRSVKVSFAPREDVSIRVRAFVNVQPTKAAGQETPDELGRGIYVPVETAVSVDNYRNQMIAQCKRDIEAFRRKYAALAEVSRILQEMDQFETITSNATDI